jgi:hypothetical protein
MSTARHRYHFPVPSHRTVLPASISDLSRASLFSVSSVPGLSALCVELFSVAVATLPTLCFHQLTNCFFRNSRVFKNFCVALCFFQIPSQKENQNDPVRL